MARNNDRDRGNTKRGPKDLGRRTKKKICVFCKDHTEWVDYKDVNVLRRFMSDRGKIRARRVSGNCAQHQRDVAVAIKTARELALLPYAQRTVSERTGGRRGGGRGRRDEGGEGLEVRDQVAVPEAPEAPEAEPSADVDVNDGTEEPESAEAEVGV
jgi:small subunit ribosomal protein S18